MKYFLLSVTILLTINYAHAQKTSESNSFSIKKFKDLPSWFENVERSYMLNDDRMVELELVEFIGGYFPDKGEIFFIDNKEVIFTDNQIKTTENGTIITKNLKSGPYFIRISWDKDMSTGAYSEGEINLYMNNILIFKSPLIMSGW
jgi:hypothetical protein